MDSGIEDVLGRATELEKKYEWPQASKLYEQALGQIEEDDNFGKGVIQEKIGYSLHKAAFQNEEKTRFINGLKKSINAYEAAQKLFELVTEEKKAPWQYRCQAFSKYLEHYIVTEPTEKLVLLTDCHTVKEKALDLFWEREEKQEYCRTYNELSHVTELLIFREWSPELRKDILDKEIRQGEKTVNTLSDVKNQNKAAKAQITLARYYEHYRFVEPFKREYIREQIMPHVDEALKNAEKIGDKQTIGRCFTYIARYRRSNWTEGINSYNKALEFAEETGDIFLKALILSYIGYSIYWSAFQTEDPDQRIKLADEAIVFYKKSQILTNILSFHYPNAGKLLQPDPGGYAEYYLDRAAWETDPRNKIEYLKKAEELGLVSVENAEKLGLPTSIRLASNLVSRTYTSRAKLETDLEIKRELLLKARKISESNLYSTAPQNLASWNIGIGYIYLSQIEGELALIEPEINKKTKFLDEASSSLKKGLDLCSEHVLTRSNLAILSGNLDSYGTILDQLFETRKNSEYLHEAINIWKKSIDVAQQVPIYSSMAESFWRIARTYERLNKYLESSENFNHASINYLKASENVPHLADFYQEYSTYMQAWNEIEQARYHHAENNYSRAKDHYIKAAELHDATDNWRYLSLYYQAWSGLEEAEALSRKEETEQARDGFKLTQNLFEEARRSIRQELSKIDPGKERRRVDELLLVSEIRGEYCLGREAIEKARIHDRKGDHTSSAKNYSQAAESFKRCIDAMKRETDKKELLPIFKLCQAWEKMMLAEVRTSPEYYHEAAEFFDEARTLAIDQSTSLLAQAHSSFSKALEAATRFELTRSNDSFTEAKLHIEAAMNHYLRANNQSMSDYAGATSRLLDAYMYSYNAQTETDTKKKAQLYQVTERLLQSSAGSYLKAKHPEKSDEVRRILDRVKEEREIAVSLSEILHAPTLISTTTSFASPISTQGQAIGLERLENAHILAKLITQTKELGVGDELHMEIEMVNAGKTPAQLIKIDDILIDGFELKSYPDTYRIEDGHIDLKGRALLPLKTQELKLVMRPKVKGTFEFNPRILYLDDTGNYKSCESAPVSITVKELGLKGWLRGPIS